MFEDLSKEEQDKIYSQAAYILRDLLYCIRVWEAWEVNTMTKEDFIPAAEDADILEDTARYGGYLQEYYQYYINYTSEDKNFSGKTIHVKLWDSLTPGTTRLVKIDVIGNIRSMGKE